MQGLLHPPYPATALTASALQPAGNAAAPLPAPALEDAVVAAVTKMETHDNDPTAQLEGCEQLSALLAPNGAARALTEAWAAVVRVLKRVIAAVTDGYDSADFVVAACTLLRHLAHDNSGVCGRIAQLGGPQALVAAMTRHGRNPKVVSAVLRVLWTLLAYSQDKHSEWVTGLFRAITHHMSVNVGSDEVQSTGCGALASLALWDLGGGGGAFRHDGEHHDDDADDDGKAADGGELPSPRSRINNVIGEEGLGLVLFALYVALDTFASNERVQVHALVALANLSMHPLAQVSIAELGV